MSKLRIVHISDTHGMHPRVNVPDGDVLIHTGDITSASLSYEVELFFKWFMLQPHTYKILVPGNHDFVFDKDRSRYQSVTSKNIIKEYLKLDALHFLLINEECIIENVKFWGSPYTPKIRNNEPTSWSFMKDHKDLGRIWMDIPRDVDILLTHGPAWGKLDVCVDGSHVGCEYLRFHIKEKKPKVHMFGHVHEDYGMMFDADTMYLNSSIITKGYNPENSPQIIEIDCYSKETSYKF